MAQMHNPPHPGEVLKDTVLRNENGITVTQFAKRLGVSRSVLSRVVNCKAAVSAELAVRLAAALDSTPQSWLQMQVAYDLWHAQKKRRPKIDPLGLLKSKEARAVAKRGAKPLSVAPSSGNVFADLGLPKAAELDTKVRLAVSINHLIEERRLKEVTAAEHLKASRLEVSALRKYQLDGFSVNRLKSFLLALGRQLGAAEGDYTVARDRIVGNASVDEVVDEIERCRKTRRRK
jgi:addiction module HigA family antidote